MKCIRNSPRLSKYCYSVLRFAAVVICVWMGIGCRDVTPEECQGEPLGSVKVWVEGVESLVPTQISGEVQAVETRNDELDILTIVEEGGAVRRVRFRVPGMDLPVRKNHTYAFEIHNFPGWPSTYALVIRDAEGLLFAGVSDWEVGANVAKSGVDGFNVEMVATDCESRAHHACYDEIRNAVLKVTLDDESVSLYHGESARIGDYEIRCLTCQNVVYNSSCADAGLIGVSYVIVRVLE